MTTRDCQINGRTLKKNPQMKIKLKHKIIYIETKKKTDVKSFQRSRFRNIKKKKKRNSDTKKHYILSQNRNEAEKKIQFLLFSHFY